MSQTVKAANAHTAVTTGWSTPSNAYSTTNDSAFATAAPAKNSTIDGDFGFPAFTTADIPSHATITSVIVRATWLFTISVTGGTLGMQLRRNTGGVALGSETTASPLIATDAQQIGTGATLTDLRTANELRARIRATKGNTSTGTTAELDRVYLEVNWVETITAAAGAISPSLTMSAAGKKSISKAVGALAPSLSMPEVGRKATNAGQLGSEIIANADLTDAGVLTFPYWYAADGGEAVGSTHARVVDAGTGGYAMEVSTANNPSNQYTHTALISGHRDTHSANVVTPGVRHRWSGKFKILADTIPGSPGLPGQAVTQSIRFSKLDGTDLGTGNNVTWNLGTAHSYPEFLVTGSYVDFVYETEPPADSLNASINFNGTAPLVAVGPIFRSGAWSLKAYGAAPLLTLTPTLTLASGRLITAAAGTITLSAALSEAGKKNGRGAASLSATAALSEAGKKNGTGAASLSASATLSEAGTKKGIGALSLTTSAELTEAGRKSTSGAALLSTSAAFSEIGRKAVADAALLTTSASLSETGGKSGSSSVSILVDTTMPEAGTKLASGAGLINVSPSFAREAIKQATGASSLSLSALLSMAGENPATTQIMLSMSFAMTGVATLSFVEPTPAPGGWLPWRRRKPNFGTAVQPQIMRINSATIVQPRSRIEMSVSITPAAHFDEIVLRQPRPRSLASGRVIDEISGVVAAYLASRR